jgi:hypothetical protein
MQPPHACMSPQDEGTTHLVHFGPLLILVAYPGVTVRA